MIRTRPDAPENNAGLRSVLQFAWAYEAFQRLVGKNKLRQRFVEDYVRPSAGDRILDIGCGPGDLTPFLPDCEFIGFDINSDYITAARNRFGADATFHDGELDDLVPDLEGTVDTAVSIGVLHHVPDDVVLDIARGALRSLKEGGRYIATEPHLHAGQNPIAAALIKRDRGQFVRNESEYRELLAQVFDTVEMTRDEQMLRVPYTLTNYICS